MHFIYFWFFCKLFTIDDTHVFFYFFYLLISLIMLLFFLKLMLMILGEIYNLDHYMAISSLLPLNHLHEYLVVDSHYDHFVMIYEYLFDASIMLIILIDQSLHHHYHLNSYC